MTAQPRCIVLTQDCTHHENWVEVAMDLLNWIRGQQGDSFDFGHIEVRSRLKSTHQHPNQATGIRQAGLRTITVEWMQSEFRERDE